MKCSRKIAEAAKVVEICKKIKQDFPNFELHECHLNINTEADQKLEQIKCDYDYYTKLYNNLHKQKLVNDYFETEEGKSLKLQLKDTIEEAKKNKKKIFREYQKIFSSIVKTEFGKDFGSDKDCYYLKIAHKDTIQYLQEMKSWFEDSKFHTGCCCGKTTHEHPFVEINFYNDELIVETFGFEFIDLSKNDKKQTELFIKTASFLNNKELQNQIISLYKERREKLDEIYKIIETAERKLKNPFENEDSIS